MTLQQILSRLRKCVDDYKMIKAGDKIAVGLSGGKDSMTLLSALAGLRRFYPEEFDLIAVTVDMGLDYDKQEIENIKKYCESLGVEYYIEKTQIAEVVFNERKEKSPCSLCANMRRGALNGAASKLGCNKVALGHDGDDMIETFFLSLMYEGRISTFSPVTYLERANLTVIRPMIYLREFEVASFSKNLPVLHNPCPVNHKTQREYVKNLLKDIRKDVPMVSDNVLNALTHYERVNLPKKPNQE
ncbi:MAG: tRNA 2-thiocytidine(32) synthetase TtcA [Clostridia bacterium]|nr:tRNA 2-thiocytidine(32) synthetase TtcA [Clostridia bacterium]